jgi:poly-gamma-glutamate capsule biosynthesis protein CapA/YwtB (metallophosphatase superfamily)
MAASRGHFIHARTWRVVLLALVFMLACAVLPPAAYAATNLTLAAVGDVMGHDALVDSAWSEAAGVYDFHAILAPVAPYLAAADFTIANLETPLAGPEVGYSGYPTFNSPASYAAALRDYGVDFMGTANNHCLDKGWTGIYRTLDSLDGLGIAHAGTARSATEQDQPFLVTVKGVRLAIMDYTYGTNGFPLPSGRPYAVNYLDAAAMLAEARAARAQGAELVIAFVHWGNEYERVPSSSQRDLASRLLNGGVDAVIGSHPHVVQPIERIPGTVGGRPQGVYVAYSLGNFSSNQRDRYSDSGVILYLDIVKDGGGARVAGVRYLPVYVQKTDATGRTQFRVLPVAPEIPRGADIALGLDERARMDQVWAELQDHLYRPGDGIVPFTAAPSVDPYADALAELKSRGIMIGDDSGDMHSADPVTRQQFAKLIALALGIPVSESDVCVFKDVAHSGPGALFPDNYVAAVASRGIATGRADGLFGPYQNIGRGQVVSMVVRAVRVARPGVLMEPPAGYRATWDAPLAPTHNVNAALAEHNGLLGGLPLDRLDPWGAMTRGEVAQVLFDLVRFIQ